MRHFSTDDILNPLSASYGVLGLAMYIYDNSGLTYGGLVMAISSIQNIRLLAQAVLNLLPLSKYRPSGLAHGRS